MQWESKQINFHFQESSVKGRRANEKEKGKKKKKVVFEKVVFASLINGESYKN